MFVSDNSFSNLAGWNIFLSNVTTFLNNSVPQLKTLRVSSNNLTVFRNNTLPKAELVDLSENQLTTIAGNTFGAVVDLDLSKSEVTQDDNRFGDEFIDELAAYKLTTLGLVNLSKDYSYIANNPIQDKPLFKQRFGSIYPSAQLVI